jgi:hypothetical protein
MALDSDTKNADSFLQVEFYNNETMKRPFVRIMIPGDQLNIIDQPVREDHKERFIRQWLHFQMQSEGGVLPGTDLMQWHKDEPAAINEYQVAELQILKFRTVEQVATASDSQLQRVGPSGVGLQKNARAYLQNKNMSDSAKDLADTKKQLAELQQQMSAIIGNQPRGPGRPRKEA